MEIEVIKVKDGIQVKPGLFNFKKWQKVIQCEDCSFTIAESDFINYYEPCPNCGGNFSGFLSFTGLWDKKSKSWIKRKTKYKNGGLLI